MQIKDVAASTGVSAQAIRFYERRGLLHPPARQSNGYRQYDATALSRIRFIRSAQTAGLTLAEIGSITSIRDAGEAPCEHVSTLLEEKLAEVHERQLELAFLDAELTHLIRAIQSLDPASCPAESVCHIIPES